MFFAYTIILLTPHIFFHHYKKGALQRLMILKYRTTSLSSPPHTSFSYIDNISHFSPVYNPTTSTLTVNLTLRTPIYSPIHPFLSSVPTSLVLNDLAFLLTDDGKFLDKVFDPNVSPTPFHQQKPYKPYNNRPYYKKPYYKNQPYHPTQPSINSNTNEPEDEDNNIDNNTID